MRRLGWPLPAAAVASVLAAIVVQRSGYSPVGAVFAAAIYFITWWTLLFAVLPFGVRTQHDAGEVIQGTSAGAPLEARIGRVALITTIVASIAFILIVLALGARIIPLDLRG